MNDPYQMPKRKRIPYGMMNFVDVREDNCYFVDKTRFIPALEAANKFFFFIRPRRFGKSLTISMLHHYYDVLDKAHFEKWYGDLYIGHHPTPERNSYLVIYLNFAEVLAGIDDYRSSLDAYCDIKLVDFCRRYAAFLPVGVLDELREKEGAVEQLSYLCTRCAEAGQQIYLFMDEYDHFTNKILSEPDCLNDYKRETHGTGYLRSFFDVVKTGTYSAIKRVFVTGVSPVTMDELTSGFNIGTNYSLSPEFNELVGFTEEDVRAMLDYYATTCEFHHTTDELIDIMKPWYDNYCFAKQSYGRTTIYNSNMVLYFVDNYIRGGGKIPDKMLEENIRVDYEKLKMLILSSPSINLHRVKELMRNGYVCGDLYYSGNGPSGLFSVDNFLRTLTYGGLLTSECFYRGKYKLVITNKLAEEIFSEIDMAVCEEIFSSSH